MFKSKITSEVTVKSPSPHSSNLSTEIDFIFDFHFVVVHVVIHVHSVHYYIDFVHFILQVSVTFTVNNTREKNLNRLE